MIKKKNKYPTVEILDDKNIDESESVNYEEAQNILEAELDLMMLDKKTWYNAKVFKMIQEGSSLVQLSELTGISYHSLYHTYRNTKNKLKEKITE
jgi:DNA-binding phage protein